MPIWRTGAILVGWLLLAGSAAAQFPLEGESHLPVTLSSRAETARSLPTNRLTPLAPFSTTGRLPSFAFPSSGHFQAQALTAPPPAYTASFAPPPVFPAHEQPVVGALTRTGPPRLSLPATGSFFASPPGARVSHGASWIMLETSDNPPPLPRQSRLLAP
jgi:hypothetical protein